MNKITLLLVLLSLLAFTGCKPAGGGGNGAGGGGGTHTHADGTTHGDHEDGAHEGGGHDHDAGDHGHDHDEQPIGTAMIGDMEVSGAQGHGLVEAGKLCHLVVKLPYNDGGATVVRAWIGTEDRDLYLVGKGDYAASHDDYDIHAEAPDPLPENVAWWVEIEKPDGTIVRGSMPVLK